MFSQSDKKRRGRRFTAAAVMHKKIMFTLAFIYLLCETSHLSVNHNICITSTTQINFLTLQNIGKGVLYYL